MPLSNVIVYIDGGDRPDDNSDKKHSNLPDAIEYKGAPKPLLLYNFSVWPRGQHPRFSRENGNLTNSPRGPGYAPNPVYIA